MTYAVVTFGPRWEWCCVCGVRTYDFRYCGWQLSCCADGRACLERASRFIARGEPLPAIVWPYQPVHGISVLS